MYCMCVLYNRLCYAYVPTIPGFDVQHSPNQLLNHRMAHLCRRIRQLQQWERVSCGPHRFVTETQCDSINWHWFWYFTISFYRLFNETIINQTTPEERELMFVPLNSHFILAVFSPMLLIVMVVAAILSMMPNRRTASCILAALAIPVSLTTDVFHEK